MGPFGPTELIIILILALIIFGPGKLPDVGKAIGRSVREFKRAVSGAEDESDASPGGKATGTGSGSGDGEQPKHS